MSTTRAGNTKNLQHPWTFSHAALAHSTRRSRHRTLRAGRSQEESGRGVLVHFAYVTCHRVITMQFVSGSQNINVSMRLVSQQVSFEMSFIYHCLVSHCLANCNCISYVVIYLQIAFRDFL